MRELIKHILREHVNEDRFPHNYWSIDKIKDEISKYDNIKDFREKSKSAHQAAFSLGKEVFQELTKELSRLKRGRGNLKWDEDSLEQLAKNFKTKNEFKNANQSAYTTAKSISKEFFNKITSHMISGRAIEGKRRAEESGKNFVNKSKEIFGDKYQYDKVNYINANTKLTITCPVHGDFEVRPSDHLNMGVGCKWCAVDKRSNENRTTLQDFIKQSKEVHGDTYNYDKVNYVNTHTPITITCSIHGDFQQAPNNHIGQKQGCPACGVNKAISARTKSLENFIEEASLVHDDKYDYSKVDYVNSHTKVEIICPKHGSFFQAPYTHLSGSACPICNESKGEREVRIVLKKYDINFVSQKKFQDCVNITIGKDKRTYCVQLPFDFYLPDYNIIIEYDGEQHFKPVSGWGGDKSFNRLQITDRVKNKYCEDMNIKMIRIPYTIPKKDIEVLIKNELGIK